MLHHCKTYHLLLNWLITDTLEPVRNHIGLQTLLLNSNALLGTFFHLHVCHELQCVSVGSWQIVMLAVLYENLT